MRELARRRSAGSHEVNRPGVSGGRIVGSAGWPEPVSCSVVRLFHGSRCHVVDRFVDAFVVDQSTQFRVSTSTCSTSRQGPSGRISSVL